MNKKTNLAERAWFWLVMSGFRLLYNELAVTYDLVSWVVSMGQWRDWQKTAIPFLQGQQVLEVAHGPGHMLVELKNAGYSIMGLDLSKNMGRLASRRLRKAGMKIPIIQGRVQALPFASNSFDSILTTFPSEFIVVEESLASLRRLLRPGGCLVIVAQARLTSGGIIRTFLEWLYTITGQRPIKRGKNIWLVASERFQEAGFQVEVKEVHLDKSIVTVVVANTPDFNAS